MAWKRKTRTTGYLISAQQHYFAKMCVSASAMRSQGSKGMVETARSFLTKRDLSTLDGCTERKYLSTLNRWTTSLAKKFPDNGKGNWGAARKAHNIFLFHCTMNVQLVEAHNIGHMREFQEVTLDNLMINYLNRQASDLGLERDALSEWVNIKKLGKPLSDRIQAIAQNVADDKGCDRCDLDFYAWPGSKIKDRD